MPNEEINQLSAEIVNKLDSIIKKEVESKTKELSQLEEKLLESVSFLLNTEEDAKELVKDCKDGGLSFNAIEAEGFLRAVFLIKDKFERIYGKKLEELV